MPMPKFKVALINEIEKMYKKKKAFIIFFISIAVIVLGQLAIIGIRNLSGLRAVNSSQFPIELLRLFSYTVLPFFTALVAIDSFSSELSNNTMKLMITRPISRFKIFTAKVVATSIFVLINLYVTMILSTIAGLIFNANTFQFRSFFNILLAYTVALIPIMVFTLLIIVYANIFKSGVGVFFLSIFTFLVLTVLGIVFSRFSSVFFTSLIQWHNTWLITPFPMNKVLRLLFIQLGYGTIFFTLGFYLFEKKDV
jgi:ABC-2 type transport system permease protein